MGSNEIRLCPVAVHTSALIVCVWGQMGGNYSANLQTRTLLSFIFVEYSFVVSKIIVNKTEIPFDVIKQFDVGNMTLNDANNNVVTVVNLILTI